MNKIVRIILIVVLLVIFVSSSVLLGFVIYDTQRSTKEFDHLSGLIELPPLDSTGDTPNAPTTSQPGAITNPTTPNAPASNPITRNVKKLKEMGKEVDSIVGFRNKELVILELIKVLAHVN